MTICERPWEASRAWMISLAWLHQHCHYKWRCISCWNQHGKFTRYIRRCITFARWFANGWRFRDQLNKHLIIEHNHHTRCILWYFIIISHKHQPDTNYINSRLFCGFSWYKINITPRNANLLIKKPLSSTTYTMEYLVILQKNSSRHTSQDLTAFYGSFHMKPKEKTPWNANLIIQKCLF